MGPLASAFTRWISLLQCIVLLAFMIAGLKCDRVEYFSGQQCFVFRECKACVAFAKCTLGSLFKKSFWDFYPSSNILILDLERSDFSWIFSYKERG